MDGFVPFYTKHPCTLTYTTMPCMHPIMKWENLWLHFPFLAFPYQIIIPLHLLSPYQITPPHQIILPTTTPYQITLVFPYQITPPHQIILPTTTPYQIIIPFSTLPLPRLH